MSNGVVLCGSLPRLAHATQDGSKVSEEPSPVTLKQAERSHILQTLDQTEGVIGGLNCAAAVWAYRGGR
jgi:hypothetical protein